MLKLTELSLSNLIPSIRTLPTSQTVTTGTVRSRLRPHRLIIFALWFPLTISTLIFSLMALQNSRTADTTVLPPVPLGNDLNLSTVPYKLYASLPEVLGAQTVNSYYIETQDVVPELIYAYLRKENSPMQGTSQNLVNIARKYGVDPLFMVAVAQCESNLGRKMPHTNPSDEYACHNPFGWGIHSAGTLCFDTWEQGYEAVAKGLKAKYFSQGMESPEDIMRVYTPPALEKGGSWANCVNHFLDNLDTFKRNL